MAAGLPTIVGQGDSDGKRYWLGGEGGGNRIYIPGGHELIAISCLGDNFMGGVVGGDTGSHLSNNTVLHTMAVWLLKGNLQ